MVVACSGPPLNGSINGGGGIGYLLLLYGTIVLYKCGRFIRSCKLYFLDLKK